MKAEVSALFVSKCANHTASEETRPRIAEDKAQRTPVEFAKLLVPIAESAGHLVAAHLKEGSGGSRRGENKS